MNVTLSGGPLGGLVVDWQPAPVDGESRRVDDASDGSVYVYRYNAPTNQAVYVEKG